MSISLKKHAQQRRWKGVRHRVELKSPLLENILCNENKMELFAFLSYVVGGLQQPTRKQVIGTFNDAIGLSYHGDAAKCSYKNVMIRTVLLFLRSSPAYGITGIIVGSVWNWKNFRYIPGHGRYHACWDQESAKIFHLSMYSLDVTMSACNVYIY